MKAGIFPSISGSVRFSGRARHTLTPHRARFYLCLLIGILSAVFLTGCANNRALFGKWEGDRDWKKLPVSNELAARAFAAVNLELKPNGNFILIDGGIPFTGSWVRTGDTVRLDIETYFNKSVGSQPEEVRNLMEFSLRTDGTSLWYKSKSDTSEIILKKSENQKS